MFVFSQKEKERVGDEEFGKISPRIKNFYIYIHTRRIRRRRSFSPRLFSEREREGAG